MNAKKNLTQLIIIVSFLHPLECLGRVLKASGLSYCGLVSPSKHIENSDLSYWQEQTGAGVVSFVENNLFWYGTRSQTQICAGSQKLKLSETEFLGYSEVSPYEYEGRFLSLEVFPVISEALPIGEVNLFFLGAPTIYGGAGFHLAMSDQKISNHNINSQILSAADFATLEDEVNGLSAEFGPAIKIGVEIRMIVNLSLEVNFGYGVNTNGDIGGSSKILMNFTLFD